MSKLLLLEVLLIVATSALTEGQRQIRHLKFDGAQLIDTGSGNYALYDPKLAAENNWETVSVNGGEMTTWSSDCQVKDQQEFSGSDKTLVENSRSKLDSIDGGTFGFSNGNQPFSSSTFSFEGGSSSHSNYNGGNQISSYSSNDVYMATNGNDNFSITTPSLPDGLARVFYTQKLTTFVYRNGKVQMKPTTCLSASEQQLIQQLKSEVQKIEGNMRNFQNNLNQKMQNLLPNMFYGNQFMQQNMRFMDSYMNPNQNLNMFQQSGPNPFGDNFPFGPNNSPFGPGFPFSG